MKRFIDVLCAPFKENPTCGYFRGKGGRGVLEVHSILTGNPHNNLFFLTSLRPSIFPDKPVPMGLIMGVSDQSKPIFRGANYQQGIHNMGRRHTFLYFVDQPHCPPV